MQHNTEKIHHTTQHVPHTSKIPPKQIRILMVEDNKVIQFIQKKMLIALNCEVDIAPSAEEALVMVDNHYDLLILDIGLPGMSGIELATALGCHTKYKDIPLI